LNKKDLRKTIITLRKNADELEKICNESEDEDVDFRE